MPRKTHPKRREKGGLIRCWRADAPADQWQTYVVPEGFTSGCVRNCGASKLRVNFNGDPGPMHWPLNTDERTPTFEMESKTRIHRTVPLIPSAQLALTNYLGFCDALHNV